jgi:anti-anti-sigma regulatory factor
MEIMSIGENIEVALTDKDQHHPENELLELANGLGNRTLILSFADLKWIQDFMVARLLRLHRKVRDSGGRLVLRSMRAEVYEFFLALKLDRVLDIERHENSGP